MAISKVQPMRSAEVDLIDAVNAQEIQIHDVEALSTKKSFSFSTVADMINAAENLYNGAICHTNGYYTNGDSGAAWYVIVNDAVANGMDLIACSDTLCAQLIIANDFMTPAMFGAQGDNIHDDTAYIQRCLNLCQNVLINKEYKVYVDSSQPNAIELSSNTTMLFAGGSISLVNPEELRTYAIINIANKENIVIRGDGAIIGDALEHSTSGGEWGHCVNIAASNNVTIDGLTISNAWGDGIYVTGVSNVPSEQVVIKNCVCKHNGRNNISLIYVDGCEIYNTCATDAYRTNPKAGIDIEPNTGNFVDNIYIHDCDFRGNGNFSISLGIYNNVDDLPRTITITDCLTNNRNELRLRLPNLHAVLTGIKHYFTYRTSENYANRIHCVDGASLYIEGTIYNLDGTITQINNACFNVYEKWTISNFIRSPRLLIGLAITAETLGLHRFEVNALDLSSLTDENQATQLASEVIYNFDYIKTTDAAATLASYGGVVHLTGTEAHNITFRPTRLQAGVVYTIYNDSTATWTVGGYRLAAGHVAMFKALSYGTLTLVSDSEFNQLV